jgi:hypothetical protein
MQSNNQELILQSQINKNKEQFIQLKQEISDKILQYPDNDKLKLLSIDSLNLYLVNQSETNKFSMMITEVTKGLPYEEYHHFIINRIKKLGEISESIINNTKQLKELRLLNNPPRFLDSVDQKKTLKNTYISRR